MEIQQAVGAGLASQATAAGPPAIATAGVTGLKKACEAAGIPAAASVALPPNEAMYVATRLSAAASTDSTMRGCLSFFCFVNDMEGGTRRSAWTMRLPGLSYMTIPGLISAIGAVLDMIRCGGKMGVVDFGRATRAFLFMNGQAPRVPQRHRQDNYQEVAANGMKLGTCFNFYSPADSR
ncbi:hypothetical protein FIBSPDRAFT_266036 [Athelia psychrophila]|uniref:Uncharacterized protein n=1 Tax=Athelia psychrophila TaxID=1759441 RepID=A0A165X6F2_9AGAM|nr:hypothetical protein FIBSPDRAFT_266036 [Fibularhizoctonia sp. CBS 109695]